MKKILFLIGGILLITPTVFADSASIGGDGNTVKILDDNQVQMVRETINIDVRGDDKTAEGYGNAHMGYVEVDVVYTFKNKTDEDITVKMGFPEKCEFDCFIDDPDGGSSYDGEERELVDFYKLIDFKAFEGAEELDVTFKNDEDAKTEGVNWYIYDVEFGANEEKEIRNTYWIVPFRYKNGDWFNYVLVTGASWEGVIEEVDIVVNLHDRFALHGVSEVAPSGFQFDFYNNKIKWHMEDIEPTEDDDLYIRYGNDENDGLSCMYMDDVENWASSYLDDDNENNLYYWPCEGVDGDMESSWVEGVEGDGIGEWIKVPLDPSKYYTEMKIFPGYGVSEELWEKNNRVKKAKITFSNGREWTEDFEDKFELQEFEFFNLVESPEWVTLEILEVYEGSKFDDTAIAEIQFIGYLAEAVENQGQEPVDDDDLAFPDIEGYIYEGAIEFVKEKGIVQGYPDGTYGPDKLINRAEFTKIIIEAKFPGIAAGTDCFPDVQDEWFAKYVCHAKFHEVIEGYPDGTFGPEKNINYVEALKIVLETFEYIIEDADGSWYTKYLVTAEEWGIAIPDTDPGDDLTRGKMAEIIRRVLF